MEVQSARQTRHRRPETLTPVALVLGVHLQMLEHCVDVDPLFLLHTEVGISVHFDAIFVQVDLRLFWVAEWTNDLTICSLTQVAWLRLRV